MDKAIQFSIIFLILIFSYLESSSQCDSIRTIEIDSCEYVALPMNLFISFYLSRKYNTSLSNTIISLRYEIGSLRLESQNYEQSSEILIDSILTENLKLKQSVDSYSLYTAKANTKIESQKAKITELKGRKYYFLGVGVGIGIVTSLILLR